MQGVRVEPCNQVRRDFLKHFQVAEMFGSRGGQVLTIKIKTGPQGMFAQSCRCDITFGTDHRAQAATCSSLGQAGDLSANAFEGQPTAKGESLDFGRTGQHDNRCLGQ
ncbi:hypothetical protein D3C85_1495920 [compost metagenome]